MTCQRCSGPVVKPKNYKRKYCDQCRIIVAREKNRIDQQRYRIKKILAESTPWPSASRSSASS